MKAGSYSPLHRTIETVAIFAVAILSLFLLVRLGLTVSPAQLWQVGIAAAVGYVAADLISGLVHWIFDTWGSADTPVIGRSFIAPFREHHHDPESITRHDFIETNGNNSIAMVPVLVLACFISMETGAGVFALVFVLFTSLGVLATNQIHKWAHSERAPRMVALLQRLRLILPSDHHRLHHAEPYATHYCITTGWMNPLLGAIDFHRRVERFASWRSCSSSSAEFFFQRRFRYSAGSATRAICSTSSPPPRNSSIRRASSTGRSSASR